ncbi:hypothetical protein RE428_33070 [Marinobacter nanhaiticus D15-8W]|uniref:hypothetical protein n=1 Tax=Marinobacter nanhaiticus TaxID=1305740 RepID=UPI0012B5D8A8|nr:hypothetical protein [Marinobacter nanhaiticus]BES72289.1 hypothetical protein RE428_33070 [Marinobacter nanhaiticus D15-8W]
MKWFLIYAAALWCLWHVIDLKSGSILTGFLAPFVFGFLLLAFVIWLSTRISGRSSSSGGDVSFGGFFGGGDSGGGDGGC